MPEFFDADLRGARFERVDLSDACFRSVENVAINGVDIGPLIDAELNRRPADPAG